MEPLRTYLRGATREAHERVDAAFGAFDFADRAGYVSFLHGHAAALLPLEAALARAGIAAMIEDWPARARSEALLLDLSRLGAAQPRRLSAPALGGPAEALGVLYVLEGSRLGAQLLARRAALSASPAVREATRYLRHGEGARLWTSFLACLERSSHARAAPERALAGALAAFTLFERASAEAGSPEPCVSHA